MQQRDAYFTCHQSLDVNSGFGWQPLLVLFLSFLQVTFQSWLNLNASDLTNTLSC